MRLDLALAPVVLAACSPAGQPTNEGGSARPTPIPSPAGEHRKVPVADATPILPFYGKFAESPALCGTKPWRFEPDGIPGGDTSPVVTTGQGFRCKLGVFPVGIDGSYQTIASCRRGEMVRDEIWRWRDNDMKRPLWHGTKQEFAASEGYEVSLQAYPSL